MQAVCLGDDGVQFRLDYPDPTPAAGEVPVRVLLAGICETDLQLIRGYMGFRGVLGHEFVGVAEAGRFAGQRVAGEINCACGRCNLCLSGLGNHCPHRSVVGILRHDGVFAERVCLPEANLHPIPDHVSNVAAVFVEPLAAAFQIPAQLDLSSVKRAIVLGDGRLGNLCGQVLNSRVSDLLVVGKHPPKLQRLTSLGIKTATAAPQGPNLAAVVIDEINLIGSRCGPFATAVDALAKGDVVVESLMTGRFPLRQFDAAIVAATNGDGLKVLLDPHS